MCDARKSEHSSFPGISHIKSILQDNVSQAIQQNRLMLKRPHTALFVCLFDLILYAQSTFFSVKQGRVFLGLTE